MTSIKPAVTLFGAAFFGLILLTACSSSEKPAEESGYNIPEEYKNLSGPDLAAKVPEVFAEMCEFESAEFIKKALGLGADPNAMSIDSGSPYLTALMHSMDSEEEAEAKAALLLEAGADPNREDYLGQKALHYAVAKNNAELVKLLLQYKADINAADEMGNTPLMTAADTLRFWSVEEQMAMLKLLLDNEADVNKKENTNVSVLSIASGYAAPESLDLLIKAGAEVNAACDQQITPLMAAAFRNRNPESVRLLLTKGADPHLRNQNDETALDLTQFNLDKAAASEMAAILEEAMK